MLKTVISYLKRLAVWLRQGCLLFYGLPLAICLLLLAACLLPTELGFRLVGFASQVLGVGSVWIEIQGIRKRHDIGSIAPWKEWLTKFSRFRSRAVVAAGAATLRLSAEPPRIHVWSGHPEGASLEQRSSAVEKNLRRIREDLDAHQRAADRRDRQQKEEMKRERTEREAGDKEIHDRIKEAETGSLELSTAGVVWLLVGTICSTFPGEIASLLGAR